MKGVSPSLHGLTLIWNILALVTLFIIITLIIIIIITWNVFPSLSRVTSSMAVWYPWNSMSPNDARVAELLKHHHHHLSDHNHPDHLDLEHNHPDHPDHPNHHLGRAMGDCCLPSLHSWGHISPSPLLSCLWLACWVSCWLGWWSWWWIMTIGMMVMVIMAW